MDFYKIRRFVCLFGLMQIFALTLLAKTEIIQQELYTRFLNIDELNGLSDNKILDIVQDDYGFIWIATAHGLNRFDGYGFKIFRSNESDSNSISGNYITSLTFDNTGKLWVGTKSGLNFFNRKTEAFEKFPVQSKSSNGISSAYVRDVYSDGKSSILWVETVDGTLNKINLLDASIQHIKHRKVSSTFYDYHDIFQDTAGNIWFGGRDIGPYVFNNQDELQLIKHEKNNPKKKRDMDIACILEDRSMRMWMSATDGFYQYFKDRDEFKKHLAISTFDIIEDNSGNLWLATGSGLFYFDTQAERFVSYKHTITDPYSLIGNHVNCVFIDQQKNLWAGTNNGISIIEKKKNTIKFYRSLPQHKTSVPTSPISDFLQDALGNVWIATMGNGILKWNRDDNTFESYAEKFDGKRISCLYEDSQNNIWIGLWSGRGFYKFDRNTGQFSHYAINNNSLKSDWYNDFYEDDKGRLWLGVWGYKGVSVFDRDSALVKNYSFRLNESPFDWPVYKAYATNDVIWTTSIFHFMYAFHKKNESFNNYNNVPRDFILPEWRKYHNDSITKLFNANKIYGISAESDSIVYFATEKGLIQYRDKKFRLFKEVLKSITSISELDERRLFFFSSENHIYQYNTNTGDVNLLISLKAGTQINHMHSVGGQLYIGTLNGLFKLDLRQKQLTEVSGIKADISEVSSVDSYIFVATKSGFYVINRSDKTMIEYNLENDNSEGLVSQYIQSLHVIAKRNVCFLATDKGLIAYDLQRKSFEQIDAFENLSIHQIHSNNKDTLWLATEKGLYKYNIRKERSTGFNTFTKHQSTSRLTKFIFEDSRKNVWVGSTNNGLSLLNTQSYEFDHYLSDRDNEAALWGKNTTCILELSDGRIMVGAHGLNIFDYESRQFAHKVESDGFPSNKILGMVEDDYNNIWVSTPKGLVRMSIDLHIIDVYHTDWGLEPHRLTEGILKLHSGEILIGSKTGFYAIDPKLISTVSDSSRIQLTGFKVFDKELLNDFTQKNKLTLEYDQNFFTFEFSDFTYQNTHPEFLYQLKGIDDDWVNSGKYNYATYTKIPHGKYEFMVKKKNQLNVKPARLELIIKPPFWKTKWFIALEIAVALSIFYLLFRQQINKYKMREKHLVLEQTLLRSQMNPHFVFNALIAIQSFIFKNSPKEAGRYLSKFAKLMRLFLQNTREDFILLSQELETLSHYLELQKLRFNDAFAYEISCVEQIDPDLISIPPMMAQPFIENAIEHGFRGIGYPGIIEIKYYIHDDHVRISILDNGIGVNASLANKAYDNSDHKSLAIEITKDRLRSFSNRKHKFTLEIVDRNDLLTNEQGTRVTLRVPFNKEI